jgi:hypothetical protein
MIDYDTPQSGDIGLTGISGISGAIVSLGQWMVGDPEPGNVLSSRIEHTFLVVDNFGATVEAVPWLCKFNNVKHYNKDTLYIRLPLEEYERRAVAAAAMDFVLMHRARYSAMQYPAIALHYKLHLEPKLLMNYIANSNRVICSQLVDAAFMKTATNLHRPHLNLFQDDRAQGFVLPSSLWRLSTRPGAKVFKRSLA